MSFCVFMTFWWGSGVQALYVEESRRAVLFSGQAPAPFPPAAAAVPALPAPALPPTHSTVSGSFGTWMDNVARIGGRGLSLTHRVDVCCPRAAAAPHMGREVSNNPIFYAGHVRASVPNHPRHPDDDQSAAAAPIQ